MLRYLNMFVLIGLALIGVSLAGFATQNRFLMEPGQERTPYVSLIYLGAGVLMLINGAISIRNAPPLPSKPSPRKETPEPEETP
jgi:hypothetical protein